jgi:hypothetical protein
MLADPNLGVWISALIAIFAAVGIIVAVSTVGAYVVIRVWGDETSSGTNVTEPLPSRLSA